jgi:hypothetical protein
MSDSELDLLSGAWELVSGSYVGDDGVEIDYLKAAVKSIKVLSHGKYSFVTSSAGSFYASGAGDCEAADGTYTEIPILASHPDMIGKRFAFQYLLDGDAWTNSRWENGRRVEHEVWKRFR